MMGDQLAVIYIKECKIIVLCGEYLSSMVKQI